MSVKRTDEKLWEKIKSELLSKNDNSWNARLAQQAVQEYKRRGGSYVGKKDPNNSLSKWTREDWQYTSEPKTSRYLPKKVIEKMPKTLIQKENKLKGNKLGTKVKYSAALKKIMREQNII